jgi:hypothetical protein
MIESLPAKFLHSFIKIDSSTSIAVLLLCIKDWEGRPWACKGPVFMEITGRWEREVNDYSCRDVSLGEEEGATRP